jgi:hypothetical protein
MNASMEKLLEEIHGQIFSRRQMILRSLENIVREDIGVNVAWPDLILFIKPAHLAEAIASIVQACRERVP